MIKLLLIIISLFILTACSNTPELETGEIKTFKILKETFNQINSEKLFVDVRDVLAREQIDAANIPVLFVELETGQNGTLTPYPGQGVGRTWIGADGATITFNQGVLIASRGMGDDVMGGTSSMPTWAKLKSDSAYQKELRYLVGNNRSHIRRLRCNIKSVGSETTIKVWEVDFLVRKYEEKCTDNEGVLESVYYLDHRRIVRRSRQYHSESLGYIITERLEQ